MKNQIIATLEGLRKELGPYTNDVQVGSRVWNGGAYAEGSARRADINARIWYGMLTVMIELLNNQECGVSAGQLAYLRKAFFGGMGSFSDIAIDPVVAGAEVNDRLRSATLSLFKLLG